jgi:hypothetical protein
VNKESLVWRSPTAKHDIDGKPVHFHVVGLSGSCAADVMIFNPTASPHICLDDARLLRAIWGAHAGAA